MKAKPSGNKLGLKLLLDAALLILLLLMYSAKVISQQFHEIAGLVLIGLFAVHVVINRRWVINVSKKLFDKSLPAKSRVGYLVNVLLVLSFLTIGVTGILISHTVFNLNVGGMVWKSVHYSVAALALILIGVHMALHWRMISSFVKKRIKLPQRVGRVTGAVCLAALLAFGGYSLQATSFARWIQMPFTMSSMPQGGQNMGGRPGLMPDAAAAADSAAATDVAQADGDAQASGDTAADADSESAADAVTASAQRPAMGDGHGQMQQGFSLGSAALVVARFGSIAAVFAALGYGMEWLLTRRKRRGNAGREVEHATGDA